MLRMRIAAVFVLLVAGPGSLRAQASFDPEQRLAELKLTLPKPDPPVANYVPAVRTGNLLFLAGHGECGDAFLAGKVGGGVTQGPVASVYDFKSDGTFTISLGEKVQETGTWSANATVTPKIFDHVPNLPNGRKPLVPGIYEVGGGALKMCLLPASEANTHPARCESLADNRSSIYIFTRATS